MYKTRCIVPHRWASGGRLLVIQPAQRFAAVEGSSTRSDMAICLTPDSVTLINNGMAYCFRVICNIICTNCIWIPNFLTDYHCMSFHTFLTVAQFIALCRWLWYQHLNLSCTFKLFFHVPLWPLCIKCVKSSSHIAIACICHSVLHRGE